jgi:hypothetical protein
VAPSATIAPEILPMPQKRTSSRVVIYLGHGESRAARAAQRIVRSFDDFAGRFAAVLRQDFNRPSRRHRRMRTVTQTVRHQAQTFVGKQLALPAVAANFLARLGRLTMPNSMASDFSTLLLLGHT